jgi:hypothetical protein
MGEMLERAFTEQRLLDAWRDVRAAALADGDAGPGVERFEAAVARRISEIAEELRDGTFQPHPVVPVEIAKHDGVFVSSRFLLWWTGSWSGRCLLNSTL